MRKLRIRQGIQEARQALSDAWRLLRFNAGAVIVLFTVLSLLPSLLHAGFFFSAQKGLFAAWESWANLLMSGLPVSPPMSELISETMYSLGMQGFASTILNLSFSLILTPLLLSALALLLNGRIAGNGPKAGLNAAKDAGANAKNLVIAALLCMLAGWFVEMVPSIASGLMSAVAGLLSFIPLLGPVVSVLAVILSMLISLLADFAVTVIFTYVWLCVSLEGLSGVAALVRSWQHTRNQMHETISTLIMLALLRVLAMALLALLWLFALRPLGLSIQWLVYGIAFISAAYPIFVGAAACALYLRRPTPWRGGNGPQTYKSANLDH